MVTHTISWSVLLYFGSFGQICLFVVAIFYVNFYLTFHNLDPSTLPPSLSFLISSSFLPSFLIPTPLSFLTSILLFYFLHFISFSSTKRGYRFKTVAMQCIIFINLQINYFFSPIFGVFLQFFVSPKRHTCRIVECLRNWKYLSGLDPRVRGFSPLISSDKSPTQMFRPIRIYPFRTFPSTKTLFSQITFQEMIPNPCSNPS